MKKPGIFFSSYELKLNITRYDFNKIIGITSILKKKPKTNKTT